MKNNQLTNQLIITVVIFLSAYASLMVTNHEPTVIIDWEIVLKALAASGIYHGGLWQTPPNGEKQ